MIRRDLLTIDGPHAIPQLSPAAGPASTQPETAVTAPNFPSAPHNSALAEKTRASPTHLRTPKVRPGLTPLPSVTHTLRANRPTLQF
jgi:hypothetical protein